jgi:hypothetical protein
VLPRWQRAAGYRTPDVVFDMRAPDGEGGVDEHASEAIGRQRVFYGVAAFYGFWGVPGWSVPEWSGPGFSVPACCGALKGSGMLCP